MKEETISQYVGRFLKRERRKRKMSQVSFGLNLGADERTVRRWENGELDSLDTISRIADFFGVSVRDVFSDEDDAPFHFSYKKAVRKNILTAFLLGGMRGFRFKKKTSSKNGCNLSGLP